METTVKLHSLKAADLRSYGFAGLFIAGNLVLPQVAHLAQIGGPVLLPVYFFTLIAAYKYGFFTGLLTAIASPLVNHFLFGMPPADMLAIILIKSTLLAMAASYMAQRTKDVKLLSLVAVIAFYQGFGMVAEFMLTGSWMAALQDVRIGFPGMLLQLFGGFLLLRAMKKW